MYVKISYWTFYILNDAFLVDIWRNNLIEPYTFGEDFVAVRTGIKTLQGYSISHV